MNVVYASDDGFAEIMGVSIVSLLEHSKSSQDVNIYIFDGGISEDNRSRLNAISDKYKATITFVDTDNVKVPESVVSERWTKSAFSRVFAAQLLPQEVEKVLYLDCDLLIRDDLSELYNTDISNYSAAGVSDCLSTYYRTSFGMKKDDIYINSGVMLINLKYWRDEQLSDKFLQFSESQGNKLPYAEQGMVNGVLTSTIKLLPLKYNSYSAIFDFNYDELLKYRKPKNYYSREQVEEAKNHPTIVHFTTSFASLRPWVEGSKHPYAVEWLKYKAISPWADEPLRKDNRSKKKKLFLKIFNFLPRRVAVNLAGLLHSVLVPVLRG